MNELKTLERRNKAFKRHIKKIEAEIDKRTENNRVFDIFQDSPEREELDQVRLFSLEIVMIIITIVAH